MTTSTRRRVAIVGHVSLPVALLTVVGFGLFAFIPGAVASNRSENLSSVMADAAILAAAATLVSLAGTARIVATRNALKVTNFVRTVTIEAGAIAEVEVLRGLVIRTTGGVPIRSFAYGGSLAGDLLGYRRAKAAQERCRAWRATVVHEGTASHGSVVVSFRPATWLLPLFLLAIYTAEVLTVRAAVS